MHMYVSFYRFPLLNIYIPLNRVPREGEGQGAGAPSPPRPTPGGPHRKEKQPFLPPGRIRGHQCRYGTHPLSAFPYGCNSVHKLSPTKKSICLENFSKKHQIGKIWRTNWQGPTTTPIPPAVLALLDRLPSVYQGPLPDLNQIVGVMRTSDLEERMNQIRMEEAAGFPGGGAPGGPPPPAPMPTGDPYYGGAAVGAGAVAGDPYGVGGVADAYGAKRKFEGYGPGQGAPPPPGGEYDPAGGYPPPPKRGFY